MDSFRSVLQKVVVVSLVVSLGVGSLPSRASAEEDGKASEEVSLEELEKKRKRNVAFEVVSGIFTGIGGAITLGGGTLVTMGLTSNTDCSNVEPPSNCGAGAAIATGLGLVGLGIGLPVGGGGLLGYILSHKTKKETIRKIEQREQAAIPTLRLRGGVTPDGDGASLGIGVRF